MMPLKPSLSKMNSIERLKGMLGLASKAGSLIFGTEPVSEVVRRGKCSVVFTASDASANTLKRIHKYCTVYNAEFYDTGLNKWELAQCVGKKYDISVTATENENFSNAIADLCIQINDTETNLNNTRTEAGGTI